MTRPGARYVEIVVTNAEWKAYAAANGLTGNWTRGRRYGLTPQQLHALYLQQDARCYLCGDPLPANLAKCHIDHDHSCCGPGVSCGICVRGIACASCNRLIGEAKDDPRRLRLIADNLEAANRMLGRRYATLASSEAR
jgi:hypothetical protein